MLVTAHRAGNVDDPARLRRLVDLLLALPVPAVLPLHPRTARAWRRPGWLDELERRPGSGCYAAARLPRVHRLLGRARAVLTDSGGVQKEAYLAGVPCMTLRDTTEWVETVEAGWNVLVDLDRDAALAALERRPPPERPELYGDGRAGDARRRGAHRSRRLEPARGNRPAGPPPQTHGEARGGLHAASGGPAGRAAPARGGSDGMKEVRQRCARRNRKR